MACQYHQAQSPTQIVWTIAVSELKPLTEEEDHYGTTNQQMVNCLGSINDHFRSYEFGYLKPYLTFTKSFQLNCDFMEVVYQTHLRFKLLSPKIQDVNS